MCVQVLEILLENKLDLTETELALLVLACRGSASKEQAWRVLNFLSRELTKLTQQTLEAVESLFRHALCLCTALTICYYIPFRSYIPGFRGPLACAIK